MRNCSLNLLHLKNETFLELSVLGINTTEELLSCTENQLAAEIPADSLADIKEALSAEGFRLRSDHMSFVESAIEAAMSLYNRDDASASISSFINEVMTLARPGQPVLRTAIHPLLLSSAGNPESLRAAMIEAADLICG